MKYNLILLCLHRSDLDQYWICCFSSGYRKKHQWIQHIWDSVFFSPSNYFWGFSKKIFWSFWVKTWGYIDFIWYFLGFKLSWSPVLSLRWGSIRVLVLWLAELVQLFVWMPQDYPQAAVPHPACRAAAESGGGWQLDRRSVGMSDFWHKMGCCVVAKPPPVRYANRHTHTHIPDYGQYEDIGVKRPHLGTPLPMWYRGTIPPAYHTHMLMFPSLQSRLHFWKFIWT